jgi:hypothetical protein
MSAMADLAASQAAAALSKLAHASLTPEERKAKARRAALARWGTKRGNQAATKNRKKRANR